MSIHEGTILVTGGAGFIGSALIWALNNLGIESIVVCDRLGRDDRYKHLIPLRFSDFVDADDLWIYLETPEAEEIRTIFHLGACADTTETDVRYLMHNNFEFTKKLAQIAVSRRMRFVYASSAATYGDGHEGMDDNELCIDQLRPLNAYGYSKQLFDIYAWHRALPIYGMKYFNVFGPNEDHKGPMESMVRRGFHQIQTTGSVKLFKSYRPDYLDGRQQRDFLYVKDAVAMTIFLGDVPEVIDDEPTAGIYNLGSGMAHTWVDLVSPIFEALNLPPKIEYIEMPEALRAKYQYYTCGNIQKLRSIGYTASVTPLADAVKDYVLNYLIPDKVLGA